MQLRYRTSTLALAALALILATYLTFLLFFKGAENVEPLRMFVPRLDQLHSQVLHVYDSFSFLEQPAVRERLEKFRGRMCLLMQYYHGRFPLAQHAAIQANLLNPLVACIFMLQESEEHREFFKTSFSFSEKIEYVNFGKRLVFQDIFDFLNSPAAAPRLQKSDPKVVMVLNSDVATDLSLVHLDVLLQPAWHKVMMFVSRRRTYVEDDKSFISESTRDQCYDFHSSADGFAFAAPVEVAGSPASPPQLDMQLGEYSVEGRLNYEMVHLGWRTFNPCRFVTLVHYHLESEQKRKSRNSTATMGFRKKPERELPAPDPAQNMVPPSS
jgi:hypothetical protein